MRKKFLPYCRNPLTNRFWKTIKQRQLAPSKKVERLRLRSSRTRIRSVLFGRRRTTKNKIKNKTQERKTGHKKREWPCGLSIWKPHRPRLGSWETKPWRVKWPQVQQQQCCSLFSPKLVIFYLFFNSSVGYIGGKCSSSGGGGGKHGYISLGFHPSAAHKNLRLIDRYVSTHKQTGRKDSDYDYRHININNVGKLGADPMAWRGNSHQREFSQDEDHINACVKEGGWIDREWRTTNGGKECCCCWTKKLLAVAIPTTWHARIHPRRSAALSSSGNQPPCVKTWQQQQKQTVLLLQDEIVKLQTKKRQPKWQRASSWPTTNEWARRRRRRRNGAFFFNIFQWLVPPPHGQLFSRPSA